MIEDENDTNEWVKLNGMKSKRDLGMKCGDATKTGKREKPEKIISALSTMLFIFEQET